MAEREAGRQEPEEVSIEETLPVLEQRVSEVRPRAPKVRSGIAYAFTALFAVTAILGFAASLTSHWEQAKEWLQFVIPVESAVLGYAVGYYFGKRNGS